MGCAKLVFWNDVGWSAAKSGSEFVPAPQSPRYSSIRSVVVGL